MLPIAEIIEGFRVVLTANNLLFIFFGTFFGTVVGALPGLGADTGVALLLGIIFGMEPHSAIFMLVGVYTGATFGGAITSILINTPGTPAAALTALEGYKLAQKGQAGPALGIAALSSFIGLTLSTLGLILFAPVLVKFALTFGPAEYAALILLGLSTLAFIGEAPLKNTLVSSFFGFFLGTMGMDPMGGYVRFTFGSSFLIDGVDFVAVAMGIFAVTEVFLNAEKGLSESIVQTKITSSIYPTLNQIKSCSKALIQGSTIGFFVGILPAAGQTIAAFISYAVVSKTSKHSKDFGTGVMEGVAASESGNSASCGGALLPTLTLGIPGSGTTAMILSALFMFGMKPGPLMFVKYPDMAWGICASLIVCSIFLYVLNGPLVPYLSKIILILPYTLIYPTILHFTIIGAYSTQTHVYNIVILLVFGIIGYVMVKLRLPRAPLLLTLVLGPLFESSVRQAIQIGDKSLSLFYNRPIALSILIVTAMLLFGPGLYNLIKKKIKGGNYD